MSHILSAGTVVQSPRLSESILDWWVSPGTALKMQLSMALRSHLLEEEEQWASL